MSDEMRALAQRRGLQALAVAAWAWAGRVQPLTERYLLCLSRYLKREDIARGADLREAGADIAAVVRTHDWVFPK